MPRQAYRTVYAGRRTGPPADDPRRRTDNGRFASTARCRTLCQHGNCGRPRRRCEAYADRTVRPRRWALWPRPRRGGAASGVGCGPEWCRWCRPSRRGQVRAARSAQSSSYGPVRTSAVARPTRAARFGAAQLVWIRSRGAIRSGQLVWIRSRGPARAAPVGAAGACGPAREARLVALALTGGQTAGATLRASATVSCTGIGPVRPTVRNKRATNGVGAARRRKPPAAWQ